MDVQIILRNFRTAHAEARARAAEIIAALRLAGAEETGRIASARFERFKAAASGSEFWEPADHARILRKVSADTAKSTALAARAGLGRVGELERRISEITASRAAVLTDTSLSFDAFTLGPEGKLLAALVTEQRRAVLSKMNAQDLHDTYAQAVQRKDDPAAFIDASIVEGLVSRQAVHASDADQIVTVKQLRELVEGVQLLRPPTDCPDASDLVAAVGRIKSRAAALGIENLPLDPTNPDAAAALADLADELATQAQVSDVVRFEQRQRQAQARVGA